VIASTIGGAIGLLILIAALSRGFASLTTTSFGSNFYDVQAQALLNGHFWVPSQVASLEGIRFQGHTYLYFGPFLAFIRLPIVWLWPQISGSLSQASMILGSCVLLASVSDLAWNVRVLFRGEAQLSGSEQVGQAGFLAAVAGSSVLLYLMGSPSVYYETELWGAALALASIALFTRYLLRASTICAALLSLVVLADALTRTSVAIGPVLLVFVALCVSVLGCAHSNKRYLDQQIALRSHVSHVVVLSLGTAGAVGLPLAINWIKFRTLFSIPWSQQLVALQSPTVAAFYRHHGIISLTNLSSTLGWYFRPSALGMTGLFPFFRFPSHVAISAHAAFLSAERSSSVPASMPLFTILALIGLIVVVQPRIVGLTLSRGGRWILRAAIIGSVASGITVLVFDTIANRYMADLLPFIISASIVGFTWIMGRWAKLPLMLQGISVVVVAFLALFSLMVNLSLGFEEGLVFGPSPTSQQRAALVNWQLSIHQALPIALSFPASIGEQPPAHPVDGELFVKGGCAGVYQYNSPIWNQLEVGYTGGRRIIDIELPVLPTTVTTPLLVAGSEQSSYQFFAIQYTRRGEYRLLYESEVWNRFIGHRLVVHTEWRQVSRDRKLTIDLTIPAEAPNGALFEGAIIPGVLVFNPQIPVAQTPTLTVGRFPNSATVFTGRLTEDKVPTPLCKLALTAIKSNG
jgi:hypothetical protein